MHIKHISFIIFIGEASAAYQNPSYALFASPILKYHSAHSKYKTINFGLSAKDERQFNTEDGSSNMESKKKELEMLESAMKEAEMRQKEIEDEINQIDAELFDIHNQALRANAKTSNVGAKEPLSTNSKSNFSQQDTSLPSSETFITSITKKSTFLPSIDIPFIGAGFTSLAAAVGFRKLLMSREEKKKESLGGMTSRSIPSGSTENFNILQNKLGSALKGIDDVEAEALSALKLATEALEKNNIKVVNLKSSEKLNLASKSTTSNQDENLNRQLVFAPSEAIKPTSIQQEGITELITAKQHGNEEKPLDFNTAQSFGKMINEYLFNRAKREFENGKNKNFLTASSLQPVSGDEINTLPLDLKSSATNGVEDDSSIESKTSESFSLNRNISIEKGVMIFDTRVSSQGKFMDVQSEETISSITNKFFDVPIDEEKIENTLIKIETELSNEHSTEHSTSSSNNIVLIDKSDDASMRDNEVTCNQEDTVITHEINSEKDSSSVANSVDKVLNPEPVPSEVVDLTDDEELLYPSDIISSYNAEQSRLNIIPKGTLFRNPKLSSSISKRPRKIKLNVLQFFRLRRNPKFGNFSLFGRTDEEVHREKTRQRLISLVLLAKVFEQTLQEYRE